MMGMKNFHLCPPLHTKRKKGKKGGVELLDRPESSDACIGCVAWIVCIITAKIPNTIRYLRWMWDVLMEIFEGMRIGEGFHWVASPFIRLQWWGSTLCDGKCMIEVMRSWGGQPWGGARNVIEWIRWGWLHGMTYLQLNLPQFVTSLGLGWNPPRGPGWASMLRLLTDLHSWELLETCSTVLCSVPLAWKLRARWRVGNCACKISSQDTIRWASSNNLILHPQSNS